MVNEMESGLNQESNTKKFDIVPAEKEMGTINCVVIKNIDGLEASEIARMAIKNGAFEEDIDEAGDDTYVIQFPGHQQECLTDDGISAKLRKLTSGDEIE